MFKLGLMNKFSIIKFNFYLTNQSKIYFFNKKNKIINKTTLLDIKN